MLQGGKKRYEFLMSLLQNWSIIFYLYFDKLSPFKKIEQ